MLKHEPGILQRIATLRGQCTGELVEAPDQLEAFVEQEQSCVNTMLGLVESKLEVRSAGDAQRILRQFVMLENEIAKMTEAYNDAVTQYHDRLGHISGRILAIFLGLRRAPLFETDVEFREMPKYLLG